MAQGKAKAKALDLGLGLPGLGFGGLKFGKFVIKNNQTYLLAKEFLVHLAISIVSIYL